MVFVDHALQPDDVKCHGLLSCSFVTFMCLLDVEMKLLPSIFSQGYEEEESESFDVSLTKNTQGLGITIAGYVGDKNLGEKICICL